jgi:hypothetical protein
MKNLSKTFILIVLVLAIVNTFALVIKTYSILNEYKAIPEFVGTGKASGVVAFCINNPPALNISNCSNEVNQSSYYSCWLSTNDSDAVMFTYSSSFTIINRIFNHTKTDPLFIISANGHANFTPNNDDVGNYTIQFSVSDGSGCSNGEDSESLSLRVINVNDAPYLSLHIEDQTLDEGETLHAFYLDNHFSDPDMDELNYSVLTTGSDFTLTINPLTSEVVITTVNCPASAAAVFIAQDPGGLTNSSNTVTLICLKEDKNETPGQSGGGGGGGGGSNMSFCRPEYECFDYHICTRNNTKIQRCVDTHGCQKDVYLTVPCNYIEEVVCNETWLCSEWGACLPNGTQYRECDDKKACGTANLRPEISRSCEYLGTCNDGIKNYHDGDREEGIDCGGPCGACMSTQVPGIVVEEKGMLIYIITGIILLLLTAVLFYHYFRKEINAAVAKAGWIITKRKKKQILLTSQEKKFLLTGIAELEKKFSSEKLAEILNRYSELMRFYLIRVTGEVLPAEFDLEELKTAVHKNKRKAREVLRKIFVALFIKYLKVERNKELITQRNITLLVEELRNLTLQTSEARPEDAAREVKELSIPDKATPFDKMIIMMTNAYIALEFLELDIAKKKYLEILGAYEKLSIKDQEEVFDDISRLFHHINYVNSWLAKPIG